MGVSKRVKQRPSLADSYQRSPMPSFSLDCTAMVLHPVAISKSGIWSMATQLSDVRIADPAGKPQGPQRDGDVQIGRMGPTAQSDELGTFGRWWIGFFGRGRHSVSLDEIEKIIKDSTNPLQQRMASVVRRLSFTCGARYETSRRHKKRNRTSIVSIIILSMYAIFFSMAATLSAIPPASKEILSMFSIFMASFILAFSVYEASKRYDARSESFLRCATAIQKLRDEAATILFARAVQEKDIRKVEEAYHKILAEYTDNHALLDYTAHLVSVSKVVGPRAILFRCLYLVNIWIMPTIAVLSPVILFFMFKVITYFIRINVGV